MAMFTRALPPLRIGSAWGAGRSSARSGKRRMIEAAKEAGRFAAVLGIFGAIFAATMALRVALWVPFALTE